MALEPATLAGLSEAFVPASAPPLECAEELGSGHIHGTYRVRAANGQSDLVVQRLNGTIFRDLAAVQANLARIATHLQAHLHAAAVPDPERRHLEPHPTRDGALLANLDGARWRAFPYIGGSRSVDVVEDDRTAEEGARAFGRFLVELADLPAPPLAETLPGFHDLALRAAQLREAEMRDTRGRAEAVRDERALAHRLLHTVETALEERLRAPLPQRTVHNDCKINNVLFDADSGEALCVVDLDTVMGGLVLYDFGHLVRTAVCPVEEDETDLARIRYDGERLGALARGFLGGCGTLLEPDERDTLSLAGPRMALEDGIRFLADHLNGDAYYGAKRADQNRDRARVQLRLVEMLLANEADARQRIRAVAI